MGSNHSTNPLLLRLKFGSVIPFAMLSEPMHPNPSLQGSSKSAGEGAVLSDSVYPFKTLFTS